MVNCKSILCPTDFSESSLLALREAVSLAQHFGARIHVLHVIPTRPAVPTDLVAVAAFDPVVHEEIERDTRVDLDALMHHHIPAEVNAEAIIAHGDAAEEIVVAAANLGCDLVVIATHGQTGWRHLVFGSVTEKVVRLSPCEVLTIHSSHDASANVTG